MRTIPNRTSKVILLDFSEQQFGQKDVAEKLKVAYRDGWGITSITSIEMGHYPRRTVLVVVTLQPYPMSLEIEIVLHYVGDGSVNQAILEHDLEELTQRGYTASRSVVCYDGAGAKFIVYFLEKLVFSG